MTKLLLSKVGVKPKARKCKRCDFTEQEHFPGFFGSKYSTEKVTLLDPVGQSITHPLVLNVLFCFLYQASRDTKRQSVFFRAVVYVWWLSENLKKLPEHIEAPLQCPKHVQFREGECIMTCKLRLQHLKTVPHRLKRDLEVFVKCLLMRPSDIRVHVHPQGNV